MQSIKQTQYKNRVHSMINVLKIVKESNLKSKL